MQGLEEPHHGLPVLRVEIPGRLVGEEDRGFSRDRAGHRDALLLATRQLAGEMLDSMRHLYLLEGRGHAGLALRGPHPAVGQRQLDVLVDAQVANQVETLKDEPDLAIPRAGALGLAELRDRPIVQRIAPVGRGIKQAEDREQRRLATARGPFYGDVLAVEDVQGDRVEGVRLHLIGVEDLADLVEMNKRCRGT